MSAAPEPPQGLPDAPLHHAASDDPRNGTVRNTAISPRVMTAVFVGGMAGTALRLALNAAVDDALWMGESVPFPTATVVVNLVGSGVLGLLVGAGWNGTSPWMRPAVTSGLLGSFTTFSALIAAMLPISFDRGDITGWSVSALVLVGSVAAGLIVAAVGMAAGRSLASRGTRRHKSASRPTAPQCDSDSPRGPEVIG